MKVKTNEASGSVLDWMVAKCVTATHLYPDRHTKPDIFLAEWDENKHNYSTDWSQGGPIIERENIATGLVPTEAGSPKDWCAYSYRDAEFCRESKRSYGPTPLIAAMRCYVASKLGDEVEVPDELAT
jgi:hypothetical protein